MAQIFLKYIRKNKLLTLVFILVSLNLQVIAQKQKFTIGINANYEFASSYYEKNDEISIDENINNNYRLGILAGNINDTILVNIRYGLYYQYRSFNVNLIVNDLDPDYSDYISSINTDYKIIGIPLSAYWNLYTGNNVQVKLQTGLSLEICFDRTETSDYKNGDEIKSYKLIDNNNWRTGIPLLLGIGAELKLSKSFRLGAYPYMNLYLFKFNYQVESSTASTFGINLILMKLLR